MGTNQQLALDIVANDIAVATLNRVEGALGGIERRQRTFTAATNSATTATGDFRTGLGKAANAVTNLAGDLLGANNKVANLAEGLLTMAVGGGIVTAVAAGIAVIVGAVQYLGREAREARKETDDLIASLDKAARERSGQRLRDEGQALRTRRDAIARELNELETNPFARALGTGQGRAKALREELERVNRALAEFLAQNAAFGGELPELGVTSRSPRAAADAVAKAMQERARAGAETVSGKLFGGPKGPEDPLALRLEGAFTAVIPEVQAAGAEFTNFVTTLEQVEHQMGFIADATLGIGEAFAGLGDLVGGKVGETAKKLLTPFMKIEGTYFVIKGLAKIADSLFPPNPAGLASGSGMVARGRQLLALAGGGASGGSGGGGGGGGAGRATQDARDVGRERGTVTIVVPRDAVWSPADPRAQEFIAETIQRAAGRNIVWRTA